MVIDPNYQTPLPVVEYMLDMIPDGVLNVLEPTPGLGNIVERLTGRGYNVTAPYDYFLHEKSRYDCIVMNPPFSSGSAYLANAPAGIEKGMKIGYQILWECLEQSDNVIALMPWFTISDSDVRLRFLKQYGLISVSPLPRKTFQYARIQTVVLQLQKGYTGKTLFTPFEF